MGWIDGETDLVIFTAFSPQPYIYGVVGGGGNSSGEEAAPQSVSSGCDCSISRPQWQGDKPTVTWVCWVPITVASSLV